MYYRTARSPQPGPQFDRLRVIRLRRIQIEINIKTIVNPITTIGFQINRAELQHRRNRNYGNNSQYGNSRRLPNQNSQYNNNRFPSQTGQPTGNYGNSSARVVVPWWFTGKFNNALPHVRQQRSTQNGYGSGYNQGGNQFPQNNTATDTETKMETMPDRKRVIKTAINAQRTNARPTAAATTIRTTTASATARCAPIRTGRPAACPSIILSHRDWLAFQNHPQRIEERAYFFRLRRMAHQPHAPDFSL